MHKIILFFLCFEFLLASNSISAEDLLAQQLFEKAFTKNTSNQQEKELYLPLKVNEILQDEVFVKIVKHNEIYILEDTVKYILSLVHVKYKDKFKYEKGKEFYLLSLLNQLGIESNYDDENVLISITIPAKIRSIHFVNMRFDKKNKMASIVPSRYSGGMNFYMNQQYNKADNAKIQKESMFASSDLFLNVNEYLIEGRVDYVDGNKEPLVRDRFSISKDDKVNALRYRVGDIFLPTQLRMSPRDTFGISVEKVFNINADLQSNISRVNSYGFFLSNKSRVEVFVNNRYVQSIMLDAGNHNLYDLKLPSGINRVKLKIIELGGKVEYVEFNDFSYSELLDKGVLKYGAGVGIASEKNTNTHKWMYDKKQSVSSLYADYGLAKDLTIKGGFQSSTKYYSAETEFIYGTPLGLINPYIIYSELDGEAAFKKGFEYRTNIKNINMNLGYEDRDLNYRTLDFETHETEESQRTYLNIYTSIAQINIGLSASKYIKYEGIENSFGFDLSTKIFEDIWFNANASFLDRGDEEREDSIYFTFSYEWDKGRLNYADYYSEKKKQLDMSYGSSQKYGVMNELYYENSEDYSNYNLRTVVNDEKFRLDSSYLYNSRKEQAFNVQLSTGVVFANDKVTMTAPITSSFVIVDNDDKLEKALGIKGYQENDAFVYDSFALELGNYSERYFEINQNNLDFGVDLKNFEENLQSNYLSGSTMDIEVQNFLALKGAFYDKVTKKPLSFKAFKIFNRQKGTKLTSFTNEDGVFNIAPIEAGTYNVSFVHEAGYKGIARHKFTIKEDKQGILDMGKIYIEMPKKEKVKKI